jgi:AmmeMemoRadiSam system protein A
MVALPAVARQALEEAVGGPASRADVEQPPSPGPEADRPGAAFVTLRKAGALRGCIGSITAYRPLLADVRGNAVAAGLSDPRFPPVTSDELASLTIEVSVLSPPRPREASSYEDVLRLMRPGTDGLVVESGPHRAVMLPSVWEELPDVRQYVAAVWRKAGLAPGSWPTGTSVSTFVAHSVPETGTGGDAEA